MKNALLTAALLLQICLLPAVAQNARETTVDFMKGRQTAVVADYQMAKDDLEAALRERLDKDHFGKRSSEKGYTLYKGVVWQAVSPDKVDVYYRVEGKGNQSTVTMLVSKGYDNFITTASEPAMAAQVQAFLNGFAADARAYQLRLAIEAQEKAVRKAEESYQNSVSDGDKMVREKERLEKQIADNNNDQIRRNGTLSAEREKLSGLKAQAQPVPAATR